MTQRNQVGKPQRRQAPPASPPAGGERGEIAVGEREHHEVGRILTEVDGRRGLLQPKTLAKDDVHQASLRPSPTRIACSSISPCSPITTSFERRGPAPQGLSNWWRTRSPTDCTRSRIGVPLTAHKPFAPHTFFSRARLAHL